MLNLSVKVLKYHICLYNVNMFIYVNSKRVQSKIHQTFILIGSDHMHFIKGHQSWHLCHNRCLPCKRNIQLVASHKLTFVRHLMFPYIEGKIGLHVKYTVYCYNLYPCITRFHNYFLIYLPIVCSIEKIHNWNAMCAQDKMSYLFIIALSFGAY